MSTFRNTFVAGIAALALSMNAAVEAKQEAKEPNLVQVAVAVNSEGPFAGAFSTLIGLLAGNEAIFEILTQKGQYTVFAPTNDAFDGLFAAAAANCIDLTPELVGSVLRYHVAKGRRDSGQVIASDQIRTLLGAFFSQSGGVITDNAGQMAGIIVTDVPASNGLIHVIDTVLLPFPISNQCTD